MTSRDESAPGPRLAAARLAIGLAHGLALYALTKLHDVLPAPVLGGLMLTAALAPIAALGAFGAVRPRTFALWLTAASLVLLGIGAYQGYVSVTREGEFPAAPGAFVFMAAALFITHHLVLAADAERRWLAPYGRYFDEGWRDGVRLALGVAFVGALWILLFLGAALFRLIGLSFLGDLIGKGWFAFPATTTFFAIAVHVTDVRENLVRGARTLALNLLAWLLPLMTLIAGGFVFALAFTGLGPLWKTGNAGGILLSATAALIILINATYQDGEREGYPPTVLKWAVRAAAVLLVPLTAVAAYGIALRIGQHGFTPERIYAVACLVMAVVYAGGYAWAALDRSAWMRRLERANVAAAHLAVVILVAIFSPLIDPARISVADQVARLNAGKVSAEKFDYEFLTYQAGRWGRAALDDLAANGPPAVRRRAEAARLKPPRGEPQKMTADLRRKTLEPVGGPLPEDFLRQAWPKTEEPADDCTPVCPAFARDLDGDGAPEVVVFERYARRVYARTAAQGWRPIGNLIGQTCPGDLDAVRAGRFAVRPSRGAVVELDGRVLTFAPDLPRACPPQPGGEAADAATVKPSK